MISTVERKIRASFPMVRFMQTAFPLPAANRLLKISLARVPLGFHAQREALSADGVPCVWIIPPDGSQDKVLLYLHGGGFVYGLTPPHLQMAAYLAHVMRVRILMVDYRLAPEHPFPAALEDCVTAYRWLLKQGIPARNIAVAGDSAGGNLTLTCLMKLRDEGYPLPAAAACLSPVTDLAKKPDPPQGISDPLLPPRAVKFYNQAYVAHNDALDPLISPVYGNLRALPPLLVHAGEDEILREDAARIASLATSAGVEVRLEIYPRMWHVWQLFLSLPQAVQSLDDIAGFLGVRLGHAAQLPGPTP
jgi:acetyl esterase/lipase